MLLYNTKYLDQNEWKMQEWNSMKYKLHSHYKIKIKRPSASKKYKILIKIT